MRKGNIYFILICFIIIVFSILSKLIESEYEETSDQIKYPLPPYNLELSDQLGIIYE